MEQQEYEFYSSDAIEIFIKCKKVSDEYGLKRLNAIALLKVFLQEPKGLLYDAISNVAFESTFYKELIHECDEKLKTLKESEEEDIPFTVIGYDGKNQNTISMIIDGEFSEYINDIKLAAKNTYEETNVVCSIDSIVMLDIFLRNIPSSAFEILKANGVTITGVIEYVEDWIEYSRMYEDAFKNREVLDPAMISANDGFKDISSFVTNISDKYKNVEVCEYCGREKECEQIMRTLQKRSKKNVILVGDEGVGKSSIAEMVAFAIATENCPDELKGNVVLQLRVSDVIAGTMFRGQAEEKYKYLLEYLEKRDNVILFIDEIHTIIGAGAVSSNEGMDMANALKPFLASSKAKVIGATTTREYALYIERDPAFKRRFKKILVKEPKTTEVASMLRNSIFALEEYHGVKISKKMIEYAIFISSCFNKTTNNPDRTYDLIDSAMVIAKQNHKKNVDKNSILENFAINFKKYENMSEEEKRATAYHEAGHYISWKYSGRLNNAK